MKTGNLRRQGEKGDRVLRVCKRDVVQGRKRVGEGSALVLSARAGACLVLADAVPVSRCSGPTLGLV